MKQTEQDEDMVKSYLKTFGLRASRFTSQEMISGKTPDFSTFRNNQLVFYCEVKTIEGDQRLDRQPPVEGQPTICLVSEGREESIFNRIASDIHRAVKQFDSVNRNMSYPNVLAFVSHASEYGVEDLNSVITGTFNATDGTKDPIYKNVSAGRIREEKRRVDLFLWFDQDASCPFVQFMNSNLQHIEMLCSLFSLRPQDLKKI